MITRHQQPEAGNTAAPPDFLGQSAEELHLIVPRQEAGVDHEHRLVDLEQPLLHDRHGPCNQHHQFIPVALSRSGVGLEDQVPLHAGRFSDLLEAVQEKPLEVNELNGEPTTKLVAGALVVLRVDQQCQERALLEPRWRRSSNWRASASSGVISLSLIGPFTVGTREIDSL